MKGCLRNYLQHQHEFFSYFVLNVVPCALTYPNCLSTLAFISSLVSEPGSLKFQFTVDVPSVNRFTVKHQFPMPNISCELSKMARSTPIATFDFSPPIRVLHNTTNADMFLLLSKTSNIPPKHWSSLLIWQSMQALFLLISN